MAVLSAGGVAMAASADAPSALAEAQEKRRSLANEMANLVMCMLRDHKKSPDERAEALQRGFTQVVDIEWIARFVLGGSWRSASPQQREDYVRLYRDYLSKIYVEHYAEDPGRKIRDIRVVGVAEAGEGNFKARTEVVFSDGAHMKVDYLVRDEENDNRIVDVAIEGISLLTSHRSEFAALAAHQGISGVIAALHKKLQS